MSLCRISIIVSVSPFSPFRKNQSKTVPWSNLYIGSRRLITYQRLPEGQHSDVSSGRQKDDAEGVNANDLNGFRRKVSFGSSSESLVAGLSNLPVVLQ